jgi:ribosomal protein S18 acetylase RimI-like enzyme
MSDVSFRGAGPDDVSRLVTLLSSAYRGESSRVGWTTEADLIEGERIQEQALRLELCKPRARMVIAERSSTPADAELIACVLVSEIDGYGYCGLFCVHPTLQSNGLGSSMLRRAENEARFELGLETMRLSVISLRHELIAWYERRGYRRTGVRTPFPYGAPGVGKPLRPDLELETMEKKLVRVAA